VVASRGLNFAMAEKSPVSATTTVPEAFNCAREDIAGFLELAEQRGLDKRVKIKRDLKYSGGESMRT